VPRGNEGQGRKERTQKRQVLPNLVAKENYGFGLVEKANDRSCSKGEGGYHPPRKPGKKRVVNIDSRIERAEACLASKGKRGRASSTTRKRERSKHAAPDKRIDGGARKKTVRRKSPLRQRKENAKARE